MGDIYFSEGKGLLITAIEVFDLDTGEPKHVYTIRNGCDRDTAERIKMFLRGEPVEIGIIKKIVSERKTILKLTNIKCPVPGCVASFRSNRARNNHLKVAHGGLREVIKIIFPEGFNTEQFRKIFYQHELQEEGKRLTKNIIERFLEKGTLKRIGRGDFFEVVKLVRTNEEDIASDLLGIFLEEEKSRIKATRRT